MAAPLPFAESEIRLLTALLEDAIPLGLFAPKSFSRFGHAVAPSENPNGIPSFSPGLAARADYPGSRPLNILIKSEGLASHPHSTTLTQLLQSCLHFATVTQRSHCAATPG